MSGGSYDYIEFKLTEFADELELRSGGVPEGAEKRLRIAFVDHVRALAKCAHEIEWQDSGDSSRAEEALREFFDGYCMNSADLRAKAGAFDLIVASIASAVKEVAS